MTADPIVLTDIAHRFSAKPVLSGISWSFTRGKVTVILGRSGSGKSTLLQIINGMLKPDSGRVALFGNPIYYDAIDALRLKLGYVVQHIGLFPHLTIYENIALPGKIAHRPADVMRKRVMHLLEMVQLPAMHLNKYPYQLSGGEQQRAGLCRAMLLEPPVLLMDEPFASLDTETKYSIYDHLLTIQRHEPRTIAWVSHDWEEARVMADQFLWLEAGRIKASGDKHALNIILTSFTNGR